MKKELERLYQFSSIITSTADPNQLYRRVVESARDALGLDFSTLMLLSDDKEKLTIYDAVGFPQSMIGTFSLVQGQGLSTHVVRSRQPEVVIDFASENRFDVPPVVREKGISSAICVPMMIENEPFGVLIGHTLALRVFESDEQILFQNMGNLAAVAIRNCLNMQMVRKAKEFNETVLNSLTDAIAIIEVPQMRIIDANQTFINRYGGSRAAVIGQICHVLTHSNEQPCGPPHCECPLAETVSQRRTSLCEHKHIGVDGNSVYFEIITSPIFDESGDVVQVVHVHRDVSERRRLEAQLLQAQKMESVGRLAGGIAHDFNNILTAILGYSQLLMDPDNDPRQTQEFATVIHESGKRAADLVRQILAFSRKQTLEMIPVDVNAIILNLAKMMQRVIGEDVHLVLNMGSTVPEVLADVGQIEQVITNLAVNARDAMPDGGKMIIETSLTHVDDEDAGLCDISPGEYVVICVSDNGIGIPNEIVSKIFDPFFTTKDVGRGTGLGLSTCYGIVKQHGGHLGVDSEPGEGTTFRIYLPVSTEITRVNPLERVHSTGHGTATILVVDDDQPIRKMLVNYLTTFGYSVLEAAGGVEAIEISRSHAGAIDLLLTDVIMPDMNGKAMSQKILENRPGIRVIFMSGYTHNVIAHHGVLDTGINFLEKPLRFSALMETIKRCLGR